ncbi:MAG: tetratricopeptide repeat protein [Verrucomicrobiota bacterium]
MMALRSMGWSVLFALAFLVALLAGCAAPVRQAAPVPPPTVTKTPTPEEIARFEEDHSEAIENKAEAYARYAQGLSQEMQGKREEAIEQYYQAALADPGYESLVLDVALRLVRQKQTERAYLLLTNAVASTEASAPVYAQLGWVCKQLGKKTEAIAADYQAIRRAPTSISGYQNLFFLYLDEKQNREAWKVLETAGKQDGNAAFFLDLAELFTKYRHTVIAEAEVARDQVIRSLNQARAKKPSGFLLQMKLADGYNFIGEYKQAAELYLKMQEEYAAEAQVRDAIRAKLTELYLRDKDPKKAAEQLEAIVKDHPLNPQAYYYLGGLAFEDKNYGRAIELFNRTLLLAPEFEQGYYDLAAAQINTNQVKEALQTVAKARGLFPQSFVMEYFAALAHSRAKDYGAAVRSLVAAEVVARVNEPKRLTPLFYFQLGCNYERNKQLAEAEKYLEQAIDMAPDFAEALNYLGYTWAEQGKNLEKAKTYVERALRVEPKNPAYLDSLGWIYYKMGNLAKALECVERAVALSEEADATLFEHLGDIQVALKKPAKARAAYQRSLEVEANEAIKKKLEQLPAEGN